MRNQSQPGFHTTQQTRRKALACFFDAEDAGGYASKYATNAMRARKLRNIHERRNGHNARIEGVSCVAYAALDGK